MPRNATTGIYNYPSGSEGVANYPIYSGKYNVLIADFETDANTPRPIVAGGTGANSAAGAMANLKGEIFGQIVTDFDTFAFQPGSFFANAAANAAPNATQKFTGVYYQLDSANGVVEMRALDVSAATQVKYYREKVAGAWSIWVQDGAVLNNQDFIINKSAPTVSNNAIRGQMAGKDRWQVFLGSMTDETGANVGSDFGIARFDDAGALIDSPLWIKRDTGNLYLTTPVAASSNITAIGTVQGAALVASQGTAQIRAAAGYGALNWYDAGATALWGYISYTGSTGDFLMANNVGGAYVQIHANGTGTFGGSWDMPGGNFSIGGTLTVAGAATLANLTVSYGGLISGYVTNDGFNLSGNDPGGICLRAQTGRSHVTMGFVVDGVFGANFGFSIGDNSFYFGGWSFGAGVAYRIYSSREGIFTNNGVINIRLAFNADLGIGWTGSGYPYQGAVVTSIWGGQNWVRYNFLQFQCPSYAGGWATAAYA